MAYFETALAVHRDMGATPYVAFTERDREAVLRARDGRGPGTRRGAVGAGGTYDAVPPRPHGHVLRLRTGRVPARGLAAQPSVTHRA